MAILVTGGAGYIGSHTCVELLNEGYEVVVLDNLSNSSEKSLERVEMLTGKKVTFYQGDILDREILNQIFETEKIESCIHFAGLKAVGESVAKPWEYYNNNITGTLTLVDVMRQHNCKNIIFSDGCSDSEYIIASQRTSGSTNCIRVDDSGNCSNSYNVICSAKISNSFFIQDSNSLHECMFCSHIANQRYCIANMQFEKEEYFAIKKEIIKWILS